MLAFTLPAAVQSYVEQLRRCLHLEASDQPPVSASVGVVKLANEIVSRPALSDCNVCSCLSGLQARSTLLLSGLHDLLPSAKRG